MDIQKLPPVPNVPYQKMYTELFNRITDALDELKRGDFIQAKKLLERAQQQTEEMYIEADK